MNPAFARTNKKPQSFEFDLFAPENADGRKVFYDKLYWKPFWENKAEEDCSIEVDFRNGDLFLLITNSAERAETLLERILLDPRVEKARYFF